MAICFLCVSFSFFYPFFGIWPLHDRYHILSGSLFHPLLYREYFPSTF
jgi:hypothetical protein